MPWTGHQLGSPRSAEFPVHSIRAGPSWRRLLHATHCSRLWELQWAKRTRFSWGRASMCLRCSQWKGLRLKQKDGRWGRGTGLQGLCLLYCCIPGSYLVQGLAHNRCSVSISCQLSNRGNPLFTKGLGTNCVVCNHKTTEKMGPFGDWNFWLCHPDYVFSKRFCIL